MQGKKEDARPGGLQQDCRPLGCTFWGDAGAQPPGSIYINHTVKDVPGDVLLGTLPTSCSQFIPLLVFILVIPIKEMNIRTVWIFHLHHPVTEYPHAVSDPMVTVVTTVKFRKVS